MRPHLSWKFIEGVSKKLGSVDRGLLEVSCQVEIDLDSVADACSPANVHLIGICCVWQQPCVAR
jgi:hypothetical protein